MKTGFPTTSCPAALAIFPPLERKPSDDGIVAEAGTHAVDGVLGLRRTAVDEVGGIGLIGVCKRTQAYTEQPKSRAVGFAFEQAPCRSEDSSCELRRRFQ